MNTVIGQSDSNGLLGLYGLLAGLFAFFAFILAFGFFGGGLIFWYMRRQKTPARNSGGFPRLVPIHPPLVPVHPQPADNVIEFTALINLVKSLSEQQREMEKVQYMLVHKLPGELCVEDYRRLVDLVAKLEAKLAPQPPQPPQPVPVRSRRAAKPQSPQSSNTSAQ